MAAAARFLQDGLGWDWLVQHERDLTSYALEKLNAIPGLTVYGPRDPSLPEDRLGVIAVNLRDINHYLVAAILSHEYGIGTRTGCFCAHPYLMSLFHVSQQTIEELRDDLSHDDKTNMLGALRISFGFYNSRDDVDAVVAALQDINNHKWRGEYHQEKRTGEFHPVSAKTNPEGWFTL
jgi:selenocysteine lyase/cysteine desulfurase